MPVKLAAFVLFTFAYSLLFSFSPPSARSATTTHTYDDLNRLVKTVYDTGYAVTTLSYIYDSAGNILNFSISSDSIVGDIDNNGVVDLTDAVLSLQIVTGVSPSSTVYRSADIDGDGRLSTTEVVFVLREISGL